MKDAKRMLTASDRQYQPSNPRYITALQSRAIFRDNDMWDRQTHRQTDTRLSLYAYRYRRD